MWLFNQVPTRRLQQQFNFTPTRAWLDHLRLSSTRMGASGAFVSSNGLILTNHHVAAGGLQNASSPGHDYATQGFLAKTQAEELKLPGTEVSILISMDDVTAQVNAGVDPQLTGDAAVKARNAVIARIERAAQQQSGLQCNVVTLYGGAQYHLYRYKRYTDIRCAFAPEMAIAFFGGDPDNYEYPRYDLDITLLRAYENDRPARIEHFLKVSPQGIREGDLVFVSGHPGTTDRLLPVVSLEAMRKNLPLDIEANTRRERMLTDYSARGPEQRRQAQRELFGIQNSLKAQRPRFAAITDSLLARKQEEQNAMLEALNASSDLLRDYQNALAQIQSAEQARTTLQLPYRLLEGGPATTFFSHARTLVRIAAEDRKPDAQRLPEYTQSRRAPMLTRLSASVPIYPELEIVKLTEFLSFYQEKLGTGNEPIQDLLAGKSPAERARELVASSKLADPDQRRQLLDGGRDAIARSTDPMIQLALRIDERARTLRQQYESSVSEPITRGLTAINRTRFAVYGPTAYPDATGTLRLSYGIVKGYIQDEAHIPAWTTVGGAFEREARHNAQPPYQLPDSWKTARSRIEPQTPFNFAATIDITNGNSGSPVVNRRGELVGVIFDSNRQGVPNNLAFTDTQARAVSVDSRAMLEALRSIYSAGHLVQEMLNP
jgi:hypothetical protein